MKLKKPFVVLISIFLLISIGCAAEEEYEEIIFTTGEQQTLATMGAFSVELLGVFTDNHVLNGKALKFPIGIYNYSSECEFGLIIDKIIVNGWDTQIRVPMFQRISTKGKKQETLTVYYTDAGINNMEEIESIIHCPS